MAQVFIAHSRKDINFVRKLAGDLEKTGYTVWWDIADVRGGDDWVRLIPDAIRTSDFFIVVLSPNSAVSEWVEKEYHQALSLRKKVIPIMRERTNVPFALNTINYIDFTSSRDYHASLNVLFDAIGSPAEIYEGSKEAFEKYRSELKVGQSLPLLEIKLLIVGQGSVGKTSLVNRLLHNTFNLKQIKTEGIAINQWQMGDTQKRKSFSRRLMKPNTLEQMNTPVLMNIWDFGGQEIMHATHQFFLTKRGLYMLVLDARLTQEENRVEYWLKLIQSFGGESPVLIVGNKTDQHPLDIDRTGLQKKYPNITGILETSAATGAGIETLKAAIIAQVDTLPHVRDLLPETWFIVKSKLEELGKDKNFITQDEYLSLCDTNDVTDETSQDTLIGFLHDLGVVLHFHDDPRLEALGILNPQWVTNGVYRILNSHELFQSQGILSLSMLNRILDLPEYPKDKRLFIVDMMKKFELCYDIEPDRSFLIPDLLPKDEPFTGNWDNALAFHYHYYILPTSIITRFIVRMNAFIHKTVWRSGIVLKNTGNVALVKADTEDKNIYVWVSGDETTRRDFLSMIRGELEAIHKTIARIEVAERVPHPQYPNLIFDYKELLQFERDGIQEFPRSFEGKTIMVKVDQLLDGVADPRNRQQDLVDIQNMEQQWIPSQPTSKPEREPQSNTGVNKTFTNPWKSGSFYLVSFILGIVAYIIARTYGLSGYDILAAFGVGISAMLIIGILLLKYDEKLEDASFVLLVTELFKRFPFFRKSKND